MLKQTGPNHCGSGIGWRRKSWRWKRTCTMNTKGVPSMTVFLSLLLPSDWQGNAIFQASSLPLSIIYPAFPSRITGAIRALPAKIRDQRPRPMTSFVGIALRTGLCYLQKTIFVYSEERQSWLPSRTNSSLQVVCAIVSTRLIYVHCQRNSPSWQTYGRHVDGRWTFLETLRCYSSSKAFKDLVCSTCKVYIRTELMKLRQIIWVEMPAYFCLT